MNSGVVLGDLVDLVRGRTYKGSLVGEPGPALLGLGSIVPGGGFRNDFKTYGGDCPPDLMLGPGDLYVSLKGATKDGEMIGSIARLPESVPSGRLTQDTVRLVFRTRSSEVEKYVYWLLRTPHYRLYCAARATGSAVVALSRADFLSYPVPPLDDDRLRVVELLENLEAKAGVNHRLVHIAEQLADALFASTPLAESELSSVASLTMGSSPPGESYNENGVGMPFYQGVRDFGLRYPGHRVWTTQPKRLAQPNDTLISVRAPVGDLNRAIQECCVGRGVAAVHCDSPSTIYYALRAASDLWHPFQQEGTVFGAINREDLARARLPWPDGGHLVDLELKLAAIDAKVQSLLAEVELVTSLRDELLKVLTSKTMLSSLVEQAR